jgi:hypothetical protein
LEVSTLASNEQASARHGRLKSTRIAGEYSKNIFRMRVSLKTSASAASQISPPSTSSAEAFHARTSAMPGSALVLRANVPDCGANSPGLLASYDRDSSSWKTSQRCLDGDFQEFWETWPRSGMTRSGIAFALPTLAPRTEESESGLLPTPRAEERGQYQRDRGEIGKERPTLTGIAKMWWPTPTQADSDERSLRMRSTDPLFKEDGMHVMTLDRAVHLWPTPTAEDSQCKGNHPGAVDSLHAAVKLWPTTPTVQDAENDGGPSQFERNSVPLNAMVKLFATPSATDGRRGPDHGRQNRTGGGRYLVTDVGGQLNPTWVEWLMGYPLGWTALEDSATPSSRRSRNGSGKKS